jgi:hypothetical protein
MLLLAVGMIILLLPLGGFSYLGIGVMIFGYALAIWPKKQTCETDEDGNSTCKIE